MDEGQGGQLDVRERHVGDDGDSGHGGHGDHGGHGAGHGDHAAMFRDRLWVSLVLSAPSSSTAT